VLQFVLHNARLLFGAMHPNPMALNAFVGPCPLRRRPCRALATRTFARGLLQLMSAGAFLIRITKYEQFTHYGCLLFLFSVCQGVAVEFFKARQDIEPAPLTQQRQTCEPARMNYLCTPPVGHSAIQPAVQAVLLTWQAESWRLLKCESRN